MEQSSIELKTILNSSIGRAFSIQILTNTPKDTPTSKKKIDFPPLHSPVKSDTKKKEDTTNPLQPETNLFNIHTNQIIAEKEDKNEEIINIVEKEEDKNKEIINIVEN